jgi:hypothetical protein
MDFNFKFHVVLEGPLVERAVELLHSIHSQQGIIMSDLSDLQAAVTAEDTVIASAVTLIQGFAAQLAAAGTDPVALAALTSDVKTQAASLAAAVAANTPAAPAPAPAPAQP